MQNSGSVAGGADAESVTISPVFGFCRKIENRRQAGDKRSEGEL